MQPDLSSLWKTASGKTLSIIFQHLFGIPTPVEELKDAARQNNAYLIEDAAQALGGSINDHRRSRDFHSLRPSAAKKNNFCVLHAPCFDHPVPRALSTYSDDYLRDAMAHNLGVHEAKKSSDDSRLIQFIQATV